MSAQHDGIIIMETKVKGQSSELYLFLEYWHLNLFLEMSAQHGGVATETEVKGEGRPCGWI